MHLNQLQHQRTQTAACLYLGILQPVNGERSALAHRTACDNNESALLPLLGHWLKQSEATADVHGDASSPMLGQGSEALEWSSFFQPDCFFNFMAPCAGGSSGPGGCSGQTVSEVSGTNCEKLSLFSLSDGRRGSYDTSAEFGSCRTSV